MVGYDMDGVICDPSPARPKPYFKQTGEERKEFELNLIQHYLTARKRTDPLGEWCVISGRSEKYLPYTVKWLVSKELHPTGIYLRPKELPKTRESMIEHKAFWCQELKLEVFYDDDEKIVKALTALGIYTVLVK